MPIKQTLKAIKQALKSMIDKNDIEGIKAIIALPPALVEALLDDNDLLLDGISPLMYAARSGKNEIVRLLMNSFEKYVLGFSTPQTTALILAVQHGDFSMVQTTSNNLQKKLINRKEKDTGMTALHYAASIGNKAIVELLLKEGAKIDVEDNFGNTALHCAIQSKHNEIALFLIEKGLDINKLTKQSWPILYNFAKKDPKQAVTFQITAHGSLLHSAIVNNQVEQIQLLLKLGADINSKAHFQYTWLVIQYTFGSEYYEQMKSVLKLFKSKKEELKAQFGTLHIDYQLNTNTSKLVILNPENDDPSLTFLLLEVLQIELRKRSFSRDIPLDIPLAMNKLKKEQGSYTPLQLAIHLNRGEIVSLLLANSALQQETDETQETALALAIKQGSLPLVKQLIVYPYSSLEQKSGLHGYNKLRDSRLYPLDIATFLKKDDIACYLISLNAPSDKKFTSKTVQAYAKFETNKCETIKQIENLLLGIIIRKIDSHHHSLEKIKSIDNRTIKTIKEKLTGILQTACEPPLEENKTTTLIQDLFLTIISTEVMLQRAKMNDIEKNKICEPLIEMIGNDMTLLKLFFYALEETLPRFFEEILLEAKISNNKLARNFHYEIGALLSVQDSSALKQAAIKFLERALDTDSTNPKIGIRNEEIRALIDYLNTVLAVRERDAETLTTPLPSKITPPSSSPALSRLSVFTRELVKQQRLIQSEAEKETNCTFSLS